MATTNTLYPHTINAYRVYLDGDTNLLGIASVDLGEVAFKTGDLYGAGISGTLEVPILGHTNSIKLTLNWNVFIDSAIVSLKNTGSELVMRIAQQGLDLEDHKIGITPVKITATVMPTSFNLGSLEQGAASGSSTVFEVVSLLYEVDGSSRIDINKTGNKFEIDGDDQMADINEAIGLS